LPTKNAFTTDDRAARDEAVNEDAEIGPIDL
jgi:hypothetical protein